MKHLFLILLLTSSIFARAQNPRIQLQPNLKLPKDSVLSIKLISSIDNFLLASQNSNVENPLILQQEQLETFLLLDAMKGVDKSDKFQNNSFYKPYLGNVAPLNDSLYYVQISYIGIDEKAPIIRASYDFLAHRLGNEFRFSSVVMRNTRNWKTLKKGNVVFHYQASINEKKASEFVNMISQYDTKLKSTGKATDYYCIDNLIDLQKLTGIDYKLDYNGSTQTVWSTESDHRNIIFLANHNAHFDHFDPHDLFHDRLSLVLDRSKTNKPVDEGCAYLYGGSWGLSWPEIFKAFMKEIASNSETDWTKAKETPLMFKTNGYNNQADYIINALLIQKIEKEKGFPAVLELLNIGPFEKGNEKYYNVLEKLTGINRKTYNSAVWTLIRQEKANLKL